MLGNRVRHLLAEMDARRHVIRARVYIYVRAAS